MKFRSSILLICLAAGVVAVQSQGPPASGPPAAAAGVPIANDARGALVRILTPSAGQQLKVNYVEVSYELVNPGVSGGEPNFLLQLDAQDPVTTRDTSYTFTGVTPGQHTLNVQVVDANGTPVSGGRASVVFFVASPSSSLPATGPSGAAGGGHHELASAASSLPLISVIGFGALLGGLASALRARK